MGIHVCCVVGLANKRTRTHIALERFCASIGMSPMVLLEVPEERIVMIQIDYEILDEYSPFCAELLTADRTRVLLVRNLMRGHVCLNT